MRKNSNLHKLAYALEKRADFLDDAREWIYDNPELAAGLLGGAVGAGGGALVPSEDGAGGRVRNALIGALLGGGVGAGAGYLGKDAIKDLVFGNDKETRQFDKDMKALTGKTYIGGQEYVPENNLTQLQFQGEDQPLGSFGDGSLTLAPFVEADRETKDNLAKLLFGDKVSEIKAKNLGPEAGKGLNSLSNPILLNMINNATPIPGAPQGPNPFAQAPESTPMTHALLTGSPLATYIK